MSKRAAQFAIWCKFAFLASLLVLAGCSATLTQVRVPVPIECREEVPERPQMPTERLQQGGGLDDFVRAATAEIERREGYELRLRAALQACTKPIK